MNLATLGPNGWIVTPIAPTGGGAAINTLPVDPTINNSATDTVAVVIGGVASQIPMDDFLNELGDTTGELSAAGALAGTDYMTVTQGGVDKKVLLSALATFFGAVGASQAPVTSLAAGTATSSTIPLTWVNGSGGTSWAVTQRPTGSGSYTASTLSGSATSTGATVTGLSASTAYDFQVTATGTAGTSTAATLTNVSTAAAGATHSVLYYSGNTINTTLNAASSPTNGSKKYIVPAAQSTNGYFGSTPTATTARFGWGSSSTVPPADISAANNNGTGNTLNGLAPMSPGAAPYFFNEAYLWVATGSGTTVVYPWASFDGGTPICLVPAGVTINNA